MENILFQQDAQRAYDNMVRENHEQFVRWANENQEASEDKVAGEAKKPADWDEIESYIERVAAEIKAAHAEME